MGGSIIRQCGVCGKQVRRSPARVKPVNFRSYTCRNIYSHKGKLIKEEVKHRISRTLKGRKRPDMAERLKGRTHEQARRWKGNNITKSTAYHRAQRYYPLQPCEICGKEPGGDPRVERHHKDRNPLNNEPDNIQFLCENCHYKTHGRNPKGARL